MTEETPCPICGDRHHPAIGAGYHKDLITSLRSQLGNQNMKPDGHYWDHTSKEYRAMLEPKEPEAPRAS